MCEGSDSYSDRRAYYHDLENIHESGSQDNAAARRPVVLSFLVQTSQDSDLIGLGRVCPEHLGFLKSSPGDLSGKLATRGSFIL